MPSEITSDTDDELQDAAAKNADTPGDSHAKMPDDEFDDVVEDEVVKNEDVEDTAMDVSDVPLGAQVVTAIHNTIGEAIGSAEVAVKPVENPAVREGLETEFDILKEVVTRLEGLFASVYPDQPALSGGEGEDADKEAAVKSWIRNGQSNQYHMAGITSRILQVASSKKLTAVERRMLHSACKQLDTVVKTARDSKGRADSGLAKKLDEATARADRAEERLSVLLDQAVELIPAA